MSTTPGPAVGPYSPVVDAGSTVFVSGQLGLDGNGVLVGGGVEAQTEQAMTNLATRLAEVGLRLNDVVKTTCFLVDMDDYAVFNRAYVAALPGDHRPARSCVAVAALPLRGLVEVEAIAIRR